jgi:hypothetical protein
MKNVPRVLLAITLTSVFIFAATPANDPYSSLSQAERETLKPQVERWVKDQIKHNWSDLWEIQDETSELKNEILLGDRDHPDLSRSDFVEAMRETMGIGYPEIRAFTLIEVKGESERFRVKGCGKLQRENWKQTSITTVEARIVNNKVLFGMPHGTPEACKL